MRYVNSTFLFLFISFLAFSQTIQENKIDLLKRFQEADRYYYKALNTNTATAAGEKKEQVYNQIALNKFLSVEKDIISKGYFYDSLRFRLSLRAGELAHYFDSLSLALHYYLQSISLKAVLNGLPDSIIFKPFILSGHIYFYRNQLDSAAYQFKRAEEIQDRYTKKLKEGERLYNDLGVLYFQGGNYLSAANYFRKAADMLERSNPFYDDFWVNYNINYAIALFKMESYNKADSILLQLLPFHKHLNEIYNNLGLIEQKKGGSLKAISYYRKVKYNNGLDAGLENDKAESWLMIKQLDSARKSLAMADAISQKFHKSNTNIDHGLTYKISGDLAAQYKNYMEALRDYQEALHQFYPAYTEKSTHSNPQHFSGAFSYINVFNTMVAKANACNFLYNNTGKISWAMDEMACYQSCFNLIDYIERVYESDEARLFLGKMKGVIHNKPIDLAIDLYIKTNKISFLETAFAMDQKNKASVLVYHDQLNHIINPSGQLRKREQLLKEKITRLNLSTSALNNDSAIKAANISIRDLEIQLGKVQEEISKAYAPFIKADTDLGALQKMLDNNTQLLSYHLNETRVTIFKVTSSSFSFIQKDIDAGFQQRLYIFLNNLRNQPGINTNEDAGYLSAILVKGVFDKKFSRVVIIPEDELNYLPFEALKENSKYLVENYSLQYQYAALLLKKEATDFTTASIVSFAPFALKEFNDKDRQFGRISFSGDEIKKLGGHQFIGADATKGNFLHSIQGLDIVHLATHAIAASDLGKPSFIAFAPWNEKSPGDYLLYSQEIYNLSLNNKLVILSACETGYGPLVKGEGIMSLTRAFAYAGCPDIITSSWRADDEATAFITSRFHLYLKGGNPIDVALQKAKKDYLDDRSVNPRKKQPGYWANLVFIGNYQPVAASIHWFWLMAVIPVIGLIIIGYKKLWKGHS